VIGLGRGAMADGVLRSERDDGVVLLTVDRPERRNAMSRDAWLELRDAVNAIREDEDAARALGKNTFAYKLQSLSISAALAAIGGT